MSDIAISVERVSKQFRIGSRQPYHRVSEVLQNLGRRALSVPVRWFSRPATNAAARIAVPEQFWALRDISFEVKRGELFGIIGRNGAGKSTLLKILSRITEPTLGRFGIRGRVGSLLEVGTGFHPELTGRENVFLNGSILGMTHREIQRHFDEIVAFAEVERFLDTPVKHYSSGMAVRLGFAVAAHMLPDVLIVDEVLAVGDAAFQKKCLGKMDDAAASGRTVLFVSHNMAAMQRLCTRALLLEKNRVRCIGACSDVVQQYLGDRTGDSPRWQRTAPPTSTPHFLSAFLCDAAGSPIANPTSADQFGVEIEYCLPAQFDGLLLGVVVCSRDGTPLFTTAPQDAGHSLPNGPGVFRSRVLFPEALFLPNEYSMLFGIFRPNESFERLDHVLSFNIIEVESLAGSLGQRRMGELQIPCSWSRPEEQKI